MSSNHEQVESGKFYPLESPLYLACCDCGLVHKFIFKKGKGGYIRWATFRDNRTTGQLRRYRKYNCMRNK
jgi:hypothetical protein